MGGRVFIVDDNDSIRREEVKRFRKQGFEIVEAKDGEEAVELFINVGINFFDLVFVDIEMQPMGGIPATLRIREMGVGCMIVGITVNYNEKMMDACREAGMNLCIQKPLNDASFAEIMRMLQGRPSS